MRVVKAFAAEHAPARALRAQRRARLRPVDDRDAAAGVLQPVHRLPARASGSPSILLVGGRQVIDGTLTLGDFTAFYTYLLMLIGADADARHRARHGAARDRLGRAAVRDPRPRAADSSRRPARRRCPPGRGRVELRDVTFAYERRRAPGAARRRPRRRGRARRSRWSAPPARARRRWSSCSRGSTTSTQGAVLIDGADVREVDLASLRRAIARRRRRPVPVQRHRAREHRLRRGRTRRARRSSARPSARRRPASSPSCPTATTRASASAG